MPTLDDLIALYFETGHGGGPYFRDSDSVEFIIDGREYFRRIYEEISKTKDSQDAILIVGWQFKADMNLLLPTDPDYQSGSISQLLATKAAKGVAVRIVLNGSMWAYAIRLGSKEVRTCFRENYDSAAILRGMQIGSQYPLQDCILFDYSGAPFAGSHHQKATIIKSGDNAIAFVGGMDYWPDRLDWYPHNDPKHIWTHNPSVEGARWGWHDAGVVIGGEAVSAVWDNFTQRWTEASTLNPRNVAQLDANYTFMLQVLNQPPFAALPAPPPKPQPTSQPKQAIQVMRSRYPTKQNGGPWSGPPNNWGAFNEVYQTLCHAIRHAQQYIYIEDQFLDDSWSEDRTTDKFSLFPVLQDRIKAGSIKMIFVSSGKSDPDDPVPQLRTQKLSDLLQGVVNCAQERTDVAVWRMTNLTVHAKLMLIDDSFAAVGSANMHSRSMYGIDDELHVAVVDPPLVKDLRKRLWAEHLRIGPPPWPQTVDDALDDICLALGMWRLEWQAPGGNMWFVQDNPAGLFFAEIERERVGP